MPLAVADCVPASVQVAVIVAPQVGRRPFDNGAAYAMIGTVAGIGTSAILIVRSAWGGEWGW
jgi:hypothetical protein